MSAPSFKSFPSSLLASNPVPGTGSTSINSSHHTNASVRSGETNREETRSKKRKRAHEQPKKRDIQQTLSEKSDNHGGTELNDIGALERATKGKDVDFFWESTKESRPSYRYDTRGDSFNIQYGSLHAADIPKYYVLQQCKRSVLGLENGWWVVHRGHGTVEITDYHSHLTQSPLTGTAQRRIMIHEQSSEVFVGDERNAESSSDAELEVFDAEGGNGMEQDGTRRSSYQHRVEPQHKILPKSSPSSAAEWLELLEHQLSSGPFEPVKFSSNASFEITTSVLSKALAANSALRQDASLWLQYLRAGEEIWQKARLEEEWNNALKEAGGPDLWMAWLEWRIRAALSAVDDIVNLATRTSEIIAKGLVGEAADNARLRVLWRVVIFFRQAGYSERARAILQAQVELAFNTPSDFINLPMKEKLDYLEEFWDSEAPRIGEPSAVGWSAWRRSSHTSTPTVNPPNGNLHPTDLVDDPYARWALLEAHADEDHWMQNSAEDLDPYATVLFSDVRPFLVPLETEKGRRTARYIYLSLLGLHVPGLVASLSSSSFTLDTNWACTQLAENDFISDLFPSSLSRQHFQDSLIGIRIGRQKQYRDSFGIIREWTLNSRGPLQGIDLEGKTRMWQRFHGDGDFVRRVFKQLGENDEDLEWRTMHLAFESIFDVKRALTLSRKFLSTLQYSILLWACHAKLELIRGKQKDARKIYETVLSSSDKDDPSFYRIWWDYTEMEWLSGSKEKALKLILKAAGQDFSAASGVHVLRAKRYLEECAEKFRTIGSYRLNLIRLRLVLELITGSVESLQKVADKYLTEMCLASEQHETLTVDFLVILYHHSITLRNPFPPNVLRYHVKEGLVHYPENSIILGLHLECKRKEGIQGLKGLIEFEMNKFTRPRSTLRRVEDVYMATWDTSRWPAEMQRVRRDFEVILSSGRMHGSYIIWKIYMELVIRFYGIRSAKDLLYRAIRDFPFVKDLYLIAFGRLRSAFTAAELNGLADIMAERGLRNRFSLEDQLRGWKESRNYKTLKDDEDEGRDSELESVLKNSVG